MSESVWKPRATVAAICERDGKFLLVRESVNGDIAYNQPAGHLDPDETLMQAVVRETLEETRYRFKPTALQGIYRFKPNPDANKTYIRFLFRGEVGERIEGPLDQGIIAAEWLSYEEVCACRNQHRSPMVLQCIDDFCNGPGYPLDVISQDFA
ncbi:MAG: NUDIX hydrolase [Gammaproteobacteria bacterium]|nr:NUDIX hydrolase [Gammaproteobacteria bacterium]